MFTKSISLLLLGLGVIVLPRGVGAAERTVDRLQTEARGMYLLWADGREDESSILQQLFIHGGQIVIQWGDLERSPGKYDFAELDRKIAEFRNRGVWFTLQINGNHKPQWLFKEVPHLAERVHVQVQDEAGTLMFWDPRFQAAHLQMLTKVAEHVRGNAGGKLLGMRLNFNAVGTEQFIVPPAARDPAQWIYPAGKTAAGLPPYSEEVRAKYIDDVVRTYREAFSAWTVVFVRNVAEGEMAARLDPEFRAGRLGLFHTSSEAEPRNAATERRYGLFYDYARSGETVAYAEPWASAWGDHGGKKDQRWCSPCQWNYWTLLLDLHCGVSFVGDYYANIHFALTGQLPAKAGKMENPVGQQAEFLAAYQWTDRYAGRHNRPLETPGAWVALRENSEIKARNENLPPASWHLSRFTGDYNFLMQRLEADGSVGVGPVGPPDQRFGAFARKYAPGSVAKFRVNPEFWKSLRAAGGVVRVIYLDDAKTQSVQVNVAHPGGRELLGTIKGTGTKRWLTASFPLTPAQLGAPAAEYNVELQNGTAPVIMHMVAVERAP